MEIKNLKVMKGNFIFKGKFIKNGLDSSRFINLILAFDSPENYKMKGYPCPPNLFYIHKLSISEAIGVIINKYQVKNVKEKVKKWIEELQIGVIDHSEIEYYEKIIIGANKIAVKQFGEDYKIGEIDIRIIASFIKEGINIVHVKDKGFEETCKLLNMNVIDTPKRDLEVEKKLKRKLTK